MSKKRQIFEQTMDEVLTRQSDLNLPKDGIEFFEMDIDGELDVMCAVSKNYSPEEIFRFMGSTGVIKLDRYQSVNEWNYLAKVGGVWRKAMVKINEKSEASQSSCLYCICPREVLSQDFDQSLKNEIKRVLRVHDESYYF